MKRLLLLPAALLILAGCKKTEQTTIVPEREMLTDFLYLPTKDAVWKIHTQGGVKTDVIYPCAENSKSDFDTAWHFYYEVTATGTDTFINGNQYYIYNLKSTTHLSNCSEYPDQIANYNLYFREDASAKQILSYGAYKDEVVVDFSDEQPGTKAKPADFKPTAHISNLNSIVINNKKAPMWEMEYDHQPGIKYLYKAVGVGDNGGILPENMVTHTQVRSIDFFYKGSNNHFEFSFYPTQKIIGWVWY